MTTTDSDVRPKHATLTTLDLPDFGRPASRPELPANLYAARLERLRERMAERALDRLVLFADREHSANLAWLTGFDQRFEDAIAIDGHEDDPAILVGNECWGTAGAAPLPLRRHLHQDMSLPGQPRDRSRPLPEVLADEGIRRGARVGVVGWKSYSNPNHLDVPAYLADELRVLVGSAGTLENATDLLIDAADGLRTVNEVEQLVAFEAAACATSSGVRDLCSGCATASLQTDRSPSAKPLPCSAGTALPCHATSCSRRDRAPGSAS